LLTRIIYLIQPLGKAVKPKRDPTRPHWIWRLRQGEKFTAQESVWAFDGSWYQWYLMPMTIHIFYHIYLVYLIHIYIILYHSISFYIILYLCDHAISRFLELDGLPTWQFSSKVRSRWGKHRIWELGIRQLVEEFWGNGWETDQVHR
jgi:hypothetical protein